MASASRRIGCTKSTRTGLCRLKFTIFPLRSSSFYSDHKGIQDAILRFMTETAKVVVEYPNFYGWDLWSEPRAMRLVGPGTRTRYRQWLQNKYKTIDALNLEWYETYASFDAIDPQRTGGIGTYAMDLDWRDF